MSTQRTSYTNYESEFDYSTNEDKVSVRIRRGRSRFSCSKIHIHIISLLIGIHRLDFSKAGIHHAMHATIPYQSVLRWCSSAVSVRLLSSELTRWIDGEAVLVKGSAHRGDQLDVGISFSTSPEATAYSINPKNFIALVDAEQGQEVPQLPFCDRTWCTVENTVRQHACIITVCISS